MVSRHSLQPPGSPTGGAAGWSTSPGKRYLLFTPPGSFCLVTGLLGLTRTLAIRITDVPRVNAGKGA
jgi:hypothetical protein